MLTAVLQKQRKIRHVALEIFYIVFLPSDGTADRRKGCNNQQRGEEDNNSLEHGHKNRQQS
jgi:hypothetical protein